MEKLPGHRINTWIYYDKEGYIYTVDRCTESKRYYRCRDKNCPGRATTLLPEGSPILRSHPHSHVASSNRLVTAPFLEELKRLASTDSRRLPDVYRDVALKFPDAAKLMTYRNVESRLRRLRLSTLASREGTLRQCDLRDKVTVKTEPSNSAPSGSEISTTVCIMPAQHRNTLLASTSVQCSGDSPHTLSQDNSVHSANIDYKLIEQLSQPSKCVQDKTEVFASLPNKLAPDYSGKSVDNDDPSNTTEHRKIVPCDGIQLFVCVLPNSNGQSTDKLVLNNTQQSSEVPSRKSDSVEGSAHVLCSLPPDSSESATNITAALEQESEVVCNHPRPQVPTITVKSECVASVQVNEDLHEPLNIKRETVQSESSPDSGSGDAVECKDCGTSFGEVVLLLTHICVQNTPAKFATQPLACPICGREFSHAWTLDNHLLLHSGRKTYSCEVCKMCFTLQTSLVRHIRIHTGERRFKCCFCHKWFSQKGHCKTHEFTHSTKKPYACNECGKSFVCKMSLKRHIFAHMGIRPHVCPTCHKGYPTHAALVVHQTTHSSERPFVCEVCGKTFALRGNLKDHRRIHSAERPFTCDKCSKKFRRKSTLKAHHLTHGGYRRFFCDECGEFFTNKNAFTVHKLAHRNIKAFECSICGKDFTKKRFLDAHITLHNGCKDHRCSLCGKMFAYKETLKRHMLCHSDERAFTCDVCNKKFALKCLLVKHSIVHMNLKPFGCDVCGKFFAQKGNLTAHYKLHSGVRPFTCSQCDRSFMRESHLRNHLKAHLAGTVRIRKLMHNNCCS